MIEDLSDSELHLWAIIQNHQDKIVNMSIIQLSLYAHVSTATIVRTLKKMGFSGYSAYRDSLLESTSNNLKYPVLKEADAKIKRVILKSEIEMDNTLSNLKYKTIEKSVYKTKQAKMIYLFARGLSENIAKELQTKFHLTGKYAEMYGEPSIIKPITSKIKKNCLVIFVTLNGHTPELVEAAKILRKHHVPTITFTTNAKATIIPYSNLVFLGYKSQTNYFPKFEVASRMPLQIMARIFMDAYVVRTHNIK